MIGILTGFAALVVIALVVAIALMGWGGRVGRAQQIGLCLMAAGLVWAGPARFLGYGPGLGDLAFLIGIALYVAAIHGPALWRRVDALDGAQDGWIGHAMRPDPVPQAPQQPPPPRTPRPGSNGRHLG